MVASEAKPTGRVRSLPRVLYVVALDPTVKFGSLEEQILMLAQAFDKQGGLFLPVFVSPLGGEAKRAYEEAGVAAESLDLLKFHLRDLRRLIDLVRDQDIDIIHWSFYHPINPYAWCLSVLRPGLRHYFTDHVSRVNGTLPARPWLRRRLKGALYSRYGRIATISDFVSRSLEREGVSRGVKRYYYFLNTDRFQPDPTTREEVRRELVSHERFVALTVAHLIPEKGIDVLLRAMPRLPDRVDLWIVGGGPDEKRLRALADELEVSEQVRFLGSHHEVQRFMQAADCLVCPSLWGEAAGLVNMEALACGLPVVASRVGGIPEIVEDGQTGLLFPPGDSEALAVAIRQLVENPAEQRRMGDAARDAALERYAPEQRIDEYLDFYAHATGGSEDVG